MLHQKEVEVICERFLQILSLLRQSSVFKILKNFNIAVHIAGMACNAAQKKWDYVTLQKRCERFSLSESIGCIFLESRLGALKVTNFILNILEFQ